MLGGGIADKVGNEYEIRWTLVEALRVLRGQADEIRLEPFNEKAEGFEFRVSVTGIDEWHQCKRQRSNGSWTIKALADAKVLQAFASKLTHGESGCVFVSSDPAPAFEKLIEKAHLAEYASDFYDEGGIGKSDREALNELNAAWLVDPDTQFRWLKRCRVEVTSDASLMRRLEELCGLLFKTPPGVAIDRLVRFLTNNLGQRLTTAALITAVGHLEIEWRAFMDETLDGKFGTATQEYLDTLATTISEISVDTADLNEVLRTIFQGEQQITVVAGGAGSGKSVALSRAITEAQRKGWPILAFRIDRYLNIETLSELGDALLEVDESPVSAFGNRNSTRPCLLVIDQIDAVSEASGRSGRIRELFFRMIDQTAHFASMRVVAACRSYDLDGDTRLEALSKALRATSVRLKPFDWTANVEPILDRLSVDPRRFSAREQELLCVPINLRLFASLVASGESMAGEISSTRLFDKLLEVRGRELHQAGYGWTPEVALGAVAQSMSDNQDLTAPAAVLAPFPGAIDALSSRGLLTSLGGKLQFAHESFFDQTFSRHFAASGQSVHSLLVGDEQRLFRRTQVRQIFSRLREGGQRRYVQQLREVMGASDVRYLVKDAVTSWLSDISLPTAAELAIVEEWFFPGHPLERLARVVFNGRNWFPVLDKAGTLARWVKDGGANKDLAFWLLRKGAIGYSTAVARFMAEWWRVDPPGRAEELVSWLEKLYPEDDIGLIEELYRDVLAVLPTEAVKNSFFENFELGSWVHKNRPLGARILGLWLNKWMAVFPDAHPFNDSRHHSEAYWINELATHQPDALLDAVTSPLGSALAREQASLASGKLDCPGLRPPHYEYDQEFLRSIITAIEAVAVSRPERIAALLDPLGCDADVALFLQLRAIAANGENLARLLLPLLKHPRIFKVGDGDADWLPFARAAAASMPSLSLSDRTEVESAVAGYRPEYAWALEYSRRDEAGELLWPASDKGKYLLYQLARSGQDERAILSTIGAQHLSETAKRRLSELDRKFPGEPLPEANGVRGGFVRSPIKQDYAEFMTDDQWLSAMKKYRDDANHIYDMDGVIGGARQLASVLQARTKEEPERFVTLLERVSTELNSCYAEGVLGGVRDSSVGPDVVVRAIKAARRWDDRDFDRTIGWTVQKHPAAGADPEILAFLLNSAENGEASDTAVSTSNPQKRDRVTAQELLGRDDDLSASGINGERGAAYEALASVLWEIEETLPAILALLDRRVELEPLGSVRTCMAHTINSVGKYDATRAIELLERGASKDMRMLRAHSAQHMIGWVVHHSPAVVEKFAFDLQNSDKKGLEAYGYFLESLLALLDDDRNDKFVAGFTGNSVRRQMAAYRGAGNAGSERHGDRAASWLLRLFNDPSPTVRSDAVHVGWGEVLDSPKDRSALVRAYIASPAFNDHSDHLMRELETRVSQLPDLTFEAVEKVLELSGGWTDNQRHGHHTTIYHLSRVIVELYRSVAGSTVRERKILDLFDFYLQHDFYEFRTELGAYERH